MKSLKILLSAIILNMFYQVSISGMEPLSSAKEKKVSADDIKKENEYKMWLYKQHLLDRQKDQADVRGEIGRSLHAATLPIKFTCPTAKVVMAQARAQKSSLGDKRNVKYNGEGIIYYLSYPNGYSPWSAYGSQVSVDVDENGDVESIYCGVGKDADVEAVIDFKAMGVNPKDVTFPKHPIKEKLNKEYGLHTYMLPLTTEFTIIKR